MEKKNLGERPLAAITGASSGIGYELAKVFAKNGFDLIVAAEDRGIVEAAQAFRALGGEVQAVQVDLATSSGVDELYEKIKAYGKPLDSIAINAGVGVGGEFINNEIEAEINLINLNIVSVVRLSKLVLKDFVMRGQGKILVTSSIAAEMPGPYYAVYAASKSFVQSFVEAIRFEMKENKEIFITALQPGATDTNFFARAGMIDTKAGQSKKDDPATVALDGFNALMENKDHVVAGSFMNKVQSTVAKFVSESQASSLHASSTKPGSGHAH